MRKTEEYNLTLNDEATSKKKVKADEKLNVFEIFEAIRMYVLTMNFGFIHSLIRWTHFKYDIFLFNYF